MLKEVLLTDDEKDTILGLCQRSLFRLHLDPWITKSIKKIACTRLGLVICKVKGHVPHYNEAYIIVKGGWKREGNVWEFDEPTVLPNDGTYDFRGDTTPTLLEDTLTPKERRDKFIEEGKWSARIGTTKKPGTSPL